jgi:hypothetical protein
VTSICNNCRNLTSLRLPGESLSALDLLHLLPQHRSRPLIELQYCWSLQQESEVQACAALFSGLKSFTVTFTLKCINYCPNITETGLTSLVIACTRLYYLQAKHPTIDAAAAERIRDSRSPGRIVVRC